MNLLIVNGHIKWARISNGQLNRTISRAISSTGIRHGYTVKHCIADQFYTPLSEVEKFLWADRIIVHFPVNWFGLPGKFKTYLDTVLIAGEGYLYKGNWKDQGMYEGGGLLQGKPYFLIATWSASLSSFKDPLSFLADDEPDNMISDIHYIFRFLGLKSEGTFHMLNVNKNKRIPEDLDLCKSRLNEFFAKKMYSTVSKYL